MTNKSSTIFSCSKCGAQYTKWVGRCLECGGWGAIKEESVAVQAFQALKNKKTNLAPAGKTINFNKIFSQETARMKTNISEFDLVLGGGFAPGSLTLLGGEPGIGKSTLLLQVIAKIGESETNKNKKLLYVSGEESGEQTKMRFDRLNLTPRNLEFLGETNIETITSTIRELKPTLAVVDSLQTVTSLEVSGAPGNPTQLKTCLVKLMETAKNTGIPIIIVGHVTKEGSLSGPKTLEHLVDTVLYLEGDRFHEFRILRSVKNRFGSTNEAGIFEMEGGGLKEVKNPSAALLSGRNTAVPGSAITCLIEGTRPLLLEIQALVSRTQFGFPQRRASGFDLNRLQVLLAVLAKRTGLPLDTHDVFINVVGGIKAEEPAADLAVCLAIASALKNKTLPPDLAAFGEIGLGGEIRGTAQTEKRLNEIKKLGFKFALIPASDKIPKINGLKIAQIKNVKEIIEKIVK